MFGRCTAETRYRRFHGPVRAIPERYLAEALSASPFHYALVACAAPVADPGTDPARAPAPGADLDAGPAPGWGTPAGQIVALASSRLTGEGVAEVGILVEDAWQRHGLGTRLLDELVAHARDTGLRVLEAQFLAEQAWVAGLLRPHGTCRLRSTWSGIMLVSLRLSA